MFLLAPWKLESNPMHRGGLAWANGLLIATNILFYYLGVAGAVSPASPLVNVLLYGFCHAGLWHLTGNLWLLWLFGSPVNRRLGNGLYLSIYLGTIVVLGLFARYFIAVPMLGSSGGVYAIIALAVLLEPRAILNLFAIAVFPLTAIIGIFASPAKTHEWFIRWQTVRLPLLTGLVVVPLLLLGELLQYGWNWATTAHLSGFVCGLIAVLLLPTRITLRRSTLAAA